MTHEPVIAQNFDYLPLIQPFYLLRENRPLRGYASLEFTVAPLVGAIDGINERGLSITYNYAFTRDAPTEPAAPISVLVTEALTQCSTTQEAIDWITGRPRWGGGILMITDQEGDLASLELSSLQWAVRRPSGNDDLLYHTNYYFSPSMRDVQIPDDAVYNDRSPTPLRGRRLHESSETRDQRFAQMLCEPRALDQNDLALIMSDHGGDGVPSDNTLCVHGSYWYTTASLQLMPASRRIRVAFSTTCEAAYREYTLHSPKSARAN